MSGRSTEEQTQEGTRQQTEGARGENIGELKGHMRAWKNQNMRHKTRKNKTHNTTRHRKKGHEIKTQNQKPDTRTTPTGDMTLSRCVLIPQMRQRLIERVIMIY